MKIHKQLRCVLCLIVFLFLNRFADAASLPVYNAKRIRTKTVDIPLDYVGSARVDNTIISDVVNKSLVIEFKKPMQVVSTLEGHRHRVLSVGNHYFPPQTWGIAHKLGFDKWKKHIYQALGKSEKNSSFLFTGADMDNLSVQKALFKDMTVYALVTAGVEGNALRMSVDEGRFYEPGTINIIVMSNMKLTPRAMTRAIISATEAKTAAMQDMDIRSSVNPGKYQATGTGTDEIIVVEGSDRRLDVAGGHSKLGELIAKAVYDGVKEAVYRQNGLMSKRSIFKKLQERRINPNLLLTECGCFADKDKAHIAEFEEILLQPRYAAFMESAFALSDAYERGLVTDLNSFNILCRNISEEIAGHNTKSLSNSPNPPAPFPEREGGDVITAPLSFQGRGRGRGALIANQHKIETQTERIRSEDIPMIIRMAVNAILNGMLLSEK